MERRPVSEPAWSSAPPVAETGMQFEIHRVPPKGISNVFCLSHNPLGCHIHWNSQRSIPCSGKDCKPCKDGHARRWYGWLAVLNGRTDQVSILEYTASAASAVNEYYSSHRTLRGAVIEAYRRPAKKNGRLVMFLRQSKRCPDPLPKGPSRETILQKMWGVKMPGTVELATPEEVAAITERMNGSAVQLHPVVTE